MSDWLLPAPVISLHCSHCPCTVIFKSSDNLSADTILSIDVFRKGSMFASCAKVILLLFEKSCASGLARHSKHQILNVQLCPHLQRWRLCNLLHRTTPWGCGKWIWRAATCAAWLRAADTPMPWALSPAPGLISIR